MSDPLTSSDKAIPGKTGRQHHHRAAPQEGNISHPVTSLSNQPAVLYIHPAKQGMQFKAGEELGRTYGLFPLGLPALVNVLRQNGISVQGVDYSLEKELNATFNLYNWLQERKSARVILIDLHWYEHCYGAIETARYCKQALPQAAIVLGGLSATGFACEILQDFPMVDYIVRGDAEKPLLELVEALLASTQRPTSEVLAAIPNLSYRKMGELVEVAETPITYTACTGDLDGLDFSSIDFMQHPVEYLVHEYVVTDLAKARNALTTKPYTGRWVCTARGCKYNCSYCGGSRTAHKMLANRSGLIVRSPEAVAAEVKRLQDADVTQVSFSWDIAELGEEYWQTLFAEMRRLKVKIGLYDEFFQLPEIKFIEEFAKHGVPEHTCVALNPLVGNARVRRMNGKHYTNEALFDVLDALSQQKMYLFVYFSLNLPGETRATFEETVELAKEIYDFYPKSLLKILNVTHTIDPLSPMNVNADKFGLTSRMKSFQDYYVYCRDTGSADPAARSGLRRGFDMEGRDTAELEKMVAAWDAARVGRESSWWPVPIGW